MSLKRIAGGKIFQSTLPRRERRLYSGCGNPSILFQSTLPRRERPPWDWVMRLLFIFQSTLPRRERRCVSESCRSVQIISIHAPAEGATLFCIYRDFCACISIHAPAEGATGTAPEALLLSCNFNPRSREGSDYLALKKAQQDDLFQSTLPRRERQCLFLYYSFHRIFQSTLPRRERPCINCYFL